MYSNDRSCYLSEKDSASNLSGMTQVYLYIYSIQKRVCWSCSFLPKRKWEKQKTEPAHLLLAGLRLHCKYVHLYNEQFAWYGSHTWPISNLWLYEQFYFFLDFLMILLLCNSRIIQLGTQVHTESVHSWVFLQAWAEVHCLLWPL